MSQSKKGVRVPLAMAVALASFVATGAVLQAQEKDTHAAPGVTFVNRLSLEEAEAAYQDLLPDLAGGYAKSGLVDAGYVDWERFTSAPYFSPIHSNLTVHIYANDVAEGAYAAFGGKEMPVGSIVVKDGLGQTIDGVQPAPMAFMEKMAAGFSPATGDWKFAMILPNGTVVGQTGGSGAERVQFCEGCHTGAADSGDWLFFPPADIRASR